MYQYPCKFFRRYALIQGADAERVYILNLPVKKSIKAVLRQNTAPDKHRAYTLVPVPVTAQSAAHTARLPPRQREGGAVFGVLGGIEYARPHIYYSVGRFVVVKRDGSPADRRYAYVKTDPV